MTLKFKPTEKDPPPLDGIKQKISGSIELQSLISSLNETFKAIADEFDKIRKHPLYKLLESCDPNDIKNIIIEKQENDNK